MIIKFKNIHFKHSKNVKWKKVIRPNYKFFYTGDISFIEGLIRDLSLSNLPNLNEKQLSNYLLANNKNSSLIFFSKNLFIGFTSLSRDYPIFFRQKKNKFLVSNYIYEILDENFKINQKSLSEFYSCSYVLEDRTLANDYYSLGPAEIIYGNINSRKLSRFKYFEYHRTLKKKKIKKKQFIHNLDDILNKIFDSLINVVGDKPIYIPLSGGLDSRLILSKLTEKGVKNIHSFSYGLKGNSDALVAKKISEHLNVKWNFFKFNKDEFRRMYFSEFKNSYDDFSDHFSVLPNYQDLFYLKKMQREGFFKKDSYIINGQSGDFNTGMHIPDSLYNFDKNFSNKYKSILLKRIINKHFELSDTIKNISGVNYKESLNLSLNKIKGSCVSDIYERWEYEERQCKYVVNGQRAYEYLNLNWSLPLWHSDFVKFWTTVPLKYRFKQNLYRSYLNGWNYKDVFTKYTKQATAFTGYQEVLVKFLSIFLGVIFSKDDKNRILGYLDYSSRLGSFYQIFGYKNFIKNRSRVKNAIPFHIEEWLRKKID